MNAKPVVSAIIVNWNGAHHLRICLPSLQAQTFKSLEIIVVDNGSADESEQVAREFGVRWLPLGQNAGLAPALNRGARLALGDMLLFVNNDMRFDPGFVSALVTALQRSNTVFATDARQLNWEGTEAGHLAARLSTTRNAGRHSAELVPGLHFHQQAQDCETPVFMGSAACMLVRRDLFERLNGFDDRLPLGYEDVEICWRAWLHGWPTVFVPSAICWHRVGASGKSQEGEDLNFRGVLTGRLLFATKLLPAQYAVRTWAISVAALFRDLWHGSRFVKARIRILAQMALLVPQLLREKKKLFRAASSQPRRHLRSMLQLDARGVPRVQP